MTTKGAWVVFALFLSLAFCRGGAHYNQTVVQHGSVTREDTARYPAKDGVPCIHGYRLERPTDLPTYWGRDCVRNP